MPLGDSQEFFLEIEQKLSGGNAVSELAKLEDSLAGAMKRYDEFEAAGLAAAKSLDKVAAQLGAVRQKMQAAMSAGDEKAFWKLAAAEDALGKKQDELKRKVLDTNAALEKEAKTIRGLADKTAGARGALKAEDVEKAATGLKKLGGPLGKVANVVEDGIEGFTKLKGSLGSTGAIALVGAAGLAILATAVVAVTAAIVVGAVAAAKWAIGMADQRREMNLTIAAVELADGAITGLGDTITSVQRVTGQSTEKLLDLTQQLRKAGVAAGDIPEALKAISLGDTFDPKATSQLISDLKDGKTSVGALSREMSKYEDLAAKKQLGLNAQWERFQRNLSETFGGLNIEGFLRGLSKLVDLFDANTESGKALKLLFETIFGPLEDSEAIFTMIERGFLKVEIAALEAAIKIKSMTKGLDVGALKEMSSILWEMVGPAASKALEIYVGIWVFLVQVLVWITQAFTAAYNAGKSIIDSLKSLGGFDWASIGKAIVDGILGPLADPGAVADKVTKFGNNIIGTARNVLKTHSPSAVFEEIGGQTAEGFNQGLEKGQTTDALDRMADTAASDGGKGSSSSTSVTIENLNINGVEGAKDVAPSLREEIAEVFDDLAARMGANPEPA